MSDPPAGYHTLTPRIFVENVPAQVDFLRTVFDGVGEAEHGRPAEVRIGDSLLMVSDAEARGAMPAALYVYVADVDITYQRALDAGARAIEAPRETPYGDRRAVVLDPWGNLWQIAARVADTEATGR